jgi:hypothetical protein
MPHVHAETTITSSPPLPFKPTNYHLQRHSMTHALALTQRNPRNAEKNSINNLITSTSTSTTTYNFPAHKEPEMNLCACVCVALDKGVDNRYLTAPGFGVAHYPDRTDQTGIVTRGWKGVA